MIKFINFNYCANHLVNILKNKFEVENISVILPCDIDSNWKYYDNIEFDTFSDIHTLIDLHVIKQLLEIYKTKEYSKLDNLEFYRENSYLKQKELDNIIKSLEVEDKDLIFFSIWDFNISWSIYIILRLFQRYGEEFIRTRIHLGGISIDICDASYNILKILSPNIHRNISIVELAEKLFNVEYTERAFQIDLWNDDWKEMDYETSIITYYRDFLGCTNDCSFCTCSTGNYRKKIYPHLKYDNFSEEILYYNNKFKDNPKFKQVYITDNNHTRAEFNKLIDLLIKNNNVLPYSVYYEFDLLSLDDIERIKEANCFKSWGTLFLGLDSVNPLLQKQIHTRKKNKTEGWIEKLIKLREHGINAIAPIIYGFPFYKYKLNEWIIEYKALNAINTHSDSLSALMIFPNTGIYNQLKENKQIEFETLDYWNIEVPRKYHYEYEDNNRHIFNTITKLLSDDADYDRHIEQWKE